MFSKRGRLRADRVRRLQHVSPFPEDYTAVHTAQINVIRNNPVRKRDVGTCNGMLGKIKCISQGKRTMHSSDPISIYHQLIELPPTIKDHYGNV